MNFHNIIFIFSPCQFFMKGSLLPEDGPAVPWNFTKARSCLSLIFTVHGILVVLFELFSCRVPSQFFQMQSRGLLSAKKAISRTTVTDYHPGQCHVVRPAHFFKNS
jgi:hypothetical protein